MQLLAISSENPGADSDILRWIFPSKRSGFRTQDFLSGARPVENMTQCFFRSVPGWRHCPVGHPFAVSYIIALISLLKLSSNINLAHGISSIMRQDAPFQISRQSNNFTTCSVYFCSRVRSAPDPCRLRYSYEPSILEM